ncbi:MAG: MBL fold metallo-hydrolase [Proteobacteria bacterium]|nr:MBL fold metallo-hydrolase [Pseudomonadota bacterium]
MPNNQTIPRPEMFTGGNLETNCYLIPCPEGNILVDAPEGSATAFEQKKVSLLLLTHGHFDHVWDAASLASRQECPVVMHSVTQDIVNDRNLLRRIGLDLEVTPVTATSFLSEGQITLLGKTFSIFEVPGHCPGSLCLYDSQDGLLYGGDVLFAGGVGRWDLPGGDRDLLLAGIRSKLLPLPPETVVLPGHGPSTTIGREKTSNPYLQ